VFSIVSRSDSQILWPNINGHSWSLPSVRNPIRGAMTFSIMTRSIRTLSIMGLFETLSITVSSAMMLSVAFFIVMLSVDLLNVVKRSVVALLKGLYAMLLWNIELGRNCLYKYIVIVSEEKSFVTFISGCSFTFQNGYHTLFYVVS
jgi:hypothetical protein